MNDHSAPREASSDTFDGDAISRKDREFLASLSDHSLARHPLYSVPPPALPDYNRLPAGRAVEAAQKACFAAALDWMLVNYAYCKSAFMGKGGIISLVDGEMGSIASLRGFLQPYALVSEGKRGGINTRSVIDDWMKHPLRAHIDKIQTRPDKPRPTFEEDGVTVFNRYWPPAHPTSGGGIETFKTFFKRLFPDDAERAWLWNYLAHKARKPWIPMVGAIMVAEEFGSGRGTLFDILELLFGEDYVAPCTFGQLTGTSASARFNARLADALIAVVNEAVAEDGHQQAQRRLAYEALKNNIEPSPTARKPFEAKGQHVYAQRSAMSVLIATNHRDVIKLPRGDRRCCVLSCGPKMTAKETAEIRAWMAIAENIGALYRALLEAPAVPLDVFDPFDEPPPFEGRLKMIAMGETRLEDAFGAATDALEGFPLFTMTQAQRLIGYFGDYKTGDWSDKARHIVAKNAYRLRERSESNNRIKYLQRDEIIYARTKADQQRWLPAERKFIVEQLDQTEKMIVRLINTGIDISARLEEMRRRREEEDED
jgi:hypothetical protein